MNRDIILVKSGLDEQGNQQYSRVKVYKTIPKGWKVIPGATNHPQGYIWINNGCSRFAKDKKGNRLYKSGFVKKSTAVKTESTKKKCHK